MNVSVSLFLDHFNTGHRSFCVVWWHKFSWKQPFLWNLACPLMICWPQEVRSTVLCSYTDLLKLASGFRKLAQFCASSWNSSDNNNRFLTFLQASPSLPHWLRIWLSHYTAPRLLSGIRMSLRMLCKLWIRLACWGAHSENSWKVDVRNFSVSVLYILESIICKAHPLTYVKGHQCIKWRLRLWN